MALDGRFRVGFVMRILFVPEVELVATSERTPSLYRMLMEDHEVIGLRSPMDRIVFDPSRATWPRYLLYPLYILVLALQGARVARRHHVDLVFCETAHHALAGLIVAKALRIHGVWDSHTNIELLATSLGKGPVFSVLSAALERFLGSHVDAVITPTERDAFGYVQMGVPRSKVHVVRTFVKLPDDSRIAPATREPPARPSASPILLFFGSFKYAPNREALEYIDRVLAPSLEKKGFHGEIRIAGRDIPGFAFHPSIRVLGFVPHLLEAIRSADLCIVPVWHGAGVLTKVLDCMAAGVPTVLSPFAADGVPEVRDGVHAYVARDQERFPDRVLEALRSASQWRGIASAARELIETHYSWESQKRRLEDVLRVAMTSRE
ncbi:MAG: glycosyltransferase family 4 protein [Methanobacteriota archaeon]|nr:MAG: glycosyltransferase family 4 protein [Euryarchaeota archaeon]TLZ73560.1 MAG: glycosyltransferase family 4 protein [Euryarchaeota archaeon]